MHNENEILNKTKKIEQINTVQKITNDTLKSSPSIVVNNNNTIIAVDTPIVLPIYTICS